MFRHFLGIILLHILIFRLFTGIIVCNWLIPLCVLFSPCCRLSLMQLLLNNWFFPLFHRYNCVQLADPAVRALLAVVHVRHGRAQLGEDEALPGEHQGAGAARRTQTTVRVPTPQLEAPVRNVKPTVEWGIHTCLNSFLFRCVSTPCESKLPFYVLQPCLQVKVF